MRTKERSNSAQTEFFKTSNSDVSGKFYFGIPFPSCGNSFWDAIRK